MKTNHPNTSLFLSVLTVALLGILGCGGEQKPDGFPPIYPLTVHVTQEGKPLEDATVSLVSADSSMTWIIGGVTDAEGNAKMRTHGKFEGAPEGNFNVVIQKTIHEGLDEYNAAMAQGDTAAAQRIQVNMFQLVEDAYTVARDTPIKVEVTRSTRTLEVDAGPAVRIRREFLK